MAIPIYTVLPYCVIHVSKNSPIAVAAVAVEASRGMVVVVVVEAGGGRMVVVEVGRVAAVDKVCCYFIFQVQPPMS